MAILKQNSRIKLHTLTNYITSPPSPAALFTVPSTEDFTVTGAWTETDLGLSEFGVLEGTKQLLVRIGDGIFQVPLTTSTGTTFNYTHDTATEIAYDADASQLVYIDASSNDVTVWLPDTALCDGVEYIFKRIDNSVNVVTITNAFAQNIENTTSLTVNYLDAVTVTNDAKVWWII